MRVWVGWFSRGARQSAGPGALTIGATLAGRPITGRSPQSHAVALEREPALGLISTLIAVDLPDLGPGYYLDHRPVGHEGRVPSARRSIRRAVGGRILVLGGRVG